MRVVLFVLKFVETVSSSRVSGDLECFNVCHPTVQVLSLLCLAIHVVGFNEHSEPLAHLMLMCGTYFGFAVISALACLVICVGAPIPLLVDAIISSLAALCFVTTSMVSMVEAEHDHHLMYLTDYEEKQHLFFRVSRLQSIAALITGLWFLMHTVLVLDMLCISVP